MVWVIVVAVLVVMVVMVVVVVAVVGDLTFNEGEEWSRRLPAYTRYLSSCYPLLPSLCLPPFPSSFLNLPLIHLFFPPFSILFVCLYFS